MINLTGTTMKLIFAVVAASSSLANAQGILEWFKPRGEQKTTATARVRTAYDNTYMSRFFQEDPARYAECVAKGPTEANEKDKLCARATRAVYSCMHGRGNLYCGGYAFNYHGNGCLERAGMVNLLKPEIMDQIEPANRDKVCDVPGVILVFEGRCRPGKGATRPVPFAECKKRLIEIEGEEAYQKRITGIMEKHGITEQEAISGDQVGHLEITAYKTSEDHAFLKYVSYVDRPVPADYYDDGRKHGYRILMACYLPKDDVQGLIDAL